MLNKQLWPTTTFHLPTSLITCNHKLLVIKLCSTIHNCSVLIDNETLLTIFKLHYSYVILGAYDQLKAAKKHGTCTACQVQSKCNQFHQQLPLYKVKSSYLKLSID